MKTWRSEFVHNYQDAYSFGYCLYAEPEATDALADVYAGGYLPYSNAANVQNVFYMCRSLRLNLDGFILNSENRRVHGKFAGLFSTSSHPVSVLEKPEVRKLVLDYFHKVHGPSVMPEARLDHVTGHAALRDVTLYHDRDGDVVACILNGGDATVDHYWFAAYHLDYVKQSMGMWLMVDAVLQAQKAGRAFIYLGTAYGEKAKYKINFNNVEWWAGNSWRVEPKNITLKALMAQDIGKSVEQASRWQKKVVGFGGPVTG